MALINTYPCRSLFCINTNMHFFFLLLVWKRLCVLLLSYIFSCIVLIETFLCGLDVFFFLGLYNIL